MIFVSFLSMVSYLLVCIKGSTVGTRLLVTHVGPCDRPTLVAVQELDVSTRNYQATVSGGFNVTEDIADGWMVKGTMQKCQDIRNTDTCDHFRSFWVVRAGCLRSEEILSTLFQYTQPRLECPIRAGAYNLQDYPLSSADSSLTVHESKISTSVFGYMLTLEASDASRRQLFCVEAYLQLLYIRRHNWIGGRRRNHTVTVTTTPRDDDEDDE